MKGLNVKDLDYACCVDELSDCCSILESCFSPEVVHEVMNQTTCKELCELLTAEVIPSNMEEDVLC